LLKKQTSYKSPFKSSKITNDFKSFLKINFRSKLEKFWAAAKVLQDVQSSETEAETLIKPQVSTP